MSMIVAELFGKCEFENSHFLVLLVGDASLVLKRGALGALLRFPILKVTVLMCRPQKICM